MEIRDLLPVGSIVRLKDGVKKIMIFGIKQTDPENPDVEYDYLAVCYPEGNMGLDFQYLFNHEDIEEVTFKGYSDEERDKFIGQLEELYKASKTTG